MIKSLIKWNGNKFKLIEQYNLLDSFPKNINTFYDIFGGSGTISMNVNWAKKIVLNEIDSHVFSLYKIFKNYTSKEIQKHYLKIVRKFRIEIYNKNIKKDYFKLRDFYNSMDDSKKIKGIYLLVLLDACFSNTCRFNNKGMFNQTSGNRLPKGYSLEELETQCSFFQKPNVRIYNADAFKLDVENLKKDDFVYLDPPYSLTRAGYNIHYLGDEKLIELCEKLIKKNIKFAMSNVLKHKGRSNNKLKAFIKKNHLNVKHFKGYSYHLRGTSDSNSDEVLITNY